MGLKDLINKLRKQKLDQDIAAAEAANVLPAPAASTTVTPQSFLDRLVAVVKKVDERSTTKDTALHTTITTEQSSKIKYYAGQIAIFNTEKVAPSKFADTTLFDKVYLPALTIPAITETRTQTHNSSSSNINVALTDWIAKRIVSVGYKLDVVIDVSPYYNDDTHAGVDFKNGNANIQYTLSGNTVNVNGYDGHWKNFSVVIEYEKVIPQQVIRANAEYKYIAKKDITFAEMGE